MSKSRIVLAAAASAFVCAAAGEPNRLSDAERAAGWRLLWDGKTSAGWVGAKDLKTFPERGWRMEDGVLTCMPNRRWEGGWKWTSLNGGAGGGGGDICTVEKFSDFELQLDFRLDGVANSGIKYFYDPGYAKGTTLEYQILDPEHPVPPNTSAEDFETRRVASLYYFFPAHAKDVLKPRGEWNTARIVSRGRHVEHWLNGVKVLEFERGGKAFRAAFTKTKWNKPEFLRDGPWGEAKEGRILLQDHSDMVSFRNIKIRNLNPRRQGVIRLYPTVLRGGAPNMLAKAEWTPTGGNAPASVYGQGNGGAFGADSPSWSIRTDSSFYAYWEAPVSGLRHGRIYLAGAWARLSKAKLLFEWRGIPEDSDNRIRMRVFYFSGYSDVLERYFDDDVKRRLSGDPDEWRPICRTFTLPTALRGGDATAAYGFYGSDGDMTFSEPFLIDVTDAPHTLELELKGVAPVKDIEVVQLDTRDPVWRHAFEAPVTDFSATLPKAIDAFYGTGSAAGESITGHAMIVRYADGGKSRVSFPATGVFVNR